MESFVFYKSWYEAIKAMPIDDNAKAEAVVQIIAYGCGLECDEEHWAVKMVSRLIDANNLKKIAGRKGGIAKARNMEQAKQNVAVLDSASVANPSSVTICYPSNVNANANANVNDNVNIPPKGGVGERKKFVAPSVDDVRAYAAEKSLGDYAEEFHDHFTSNGWKVGRNPMKDWKAAYRNWCRSDFRVRERKTDVLKMKIGNRNYGTGNKYN